MKPLQLETFPSDSSYGELAELFEKFVAFGARRDGGHKSPSPTADSHSMMDGARFAKFSKDCGLLDRRLTTTEVDIVFTKVKAQGQRCISFDEFCEALSHVASKKGVTREQVIQQAIAAGGPASTGTRADAVKFHDGRARVTPRDRLSSDRLSSDRLSSDRLSSDRLSSDRLSEGHSERLRPENSTLPRRSSGSVLEEAPAQRRSSPSLHPELFEEGQAGSPAMHPVFGTEIGAAERPVGHSASSRSPRSSFESRSTALPALELLEPPDPVLEPEVEQGMEQGVEGVMSESDYVLVLDPGPELPPRVDPGEALCAVRVLRAMRCCLLGSAQNQHTRGCLVQWRLNLGGPHWRLIAAQAIEQEETLLVEVDELAESLASTEEELGAAVCQVSALKKDVRAQVCALDAAAARLNTAKRRAVTRILERQHLEHQCREWQQLALVHPWECWKSLRGPLPVSPRGHSSQDSSPRSPRAVAPLRQRRGEPSPGTGASPELYHSPRSRVHSLSASPPAELVPIVPKERPNRSLEPTSPELEL